MTPASPGPDVSPGPDAGAGAASASARQALLDAARVELAERGHASVSLRAVARRAGLSHAAPGYFFRDRAGMLTAVATLGFQQLTRQLQQVWAAHPEEPLPALGHAYVEFGLAHGALFDLMFRPSELDPTDAALQQAQREALAQLSAAFLPGDADAGRLPPPAVALVSWAMVHGLVTLVRDGALTAPATAGLPKVPPEEVARSLVDLHAAAMLRHAQLGQGSLDVG